MAPTSSAGTPAAPVLAAAVLAAAVTGEAEAFERLVAPHRRELSVHCYRMLGSLDDAEDAVQETLLKAWRGIAGFQGRSSLRAWLYRIATNVCLDALSGRARRVLPAALGGPADPAVPPAPDDPEVPWLQPYPDIRLDLADSGADPHAAVVRREHIELAFVAAIQYLPARQRAALLLREVIGFSAAETASLLDTTTAAVNSALQRARAALDAGLPSRALHRPTGDTAELVNQYVRAWQAADVPALVALLRADADMAMPPTPSWYHGRDAIGVYLRQLFAIPWGRNLRLRPTAANRQPALAVYAPTDNGVAHTPMAIKVFTVDGGRISAITGFVTPRLFTAFDLPHTVRLAGGQPRLFDGTGNDLPPRDSQPGPAVTTPAPVRLSSLPAGGAHGHRPGCRMTQTQSAPERYLRLGLQLDRHVEGVVDAYFGPSELAAAVDAQPPVDLRTLITDAEALLDELDDGWLRDQVVGLRTYAGVLAGESRSYADEVEGCYGVRPTFTDEAVFTAAHEQLEALLPGDGPLIERYQRWRDSILVPTDQVERTVAAVIEAARAQSNHLVELPAGEGVVLDVVHDKPWMAYNYYLGDLRGRIEVNVDVPITAINLLHLTIHETYPGHQAERACKEQLLVRGRGLLEETLVLMPAPQSLISEGIAELAPDLLLDGDGGVALAALTHDTGAVLTHGAGVELDLAQALAIERAYEPCRWVDVNAALMLHESGASTAEVHAYIEHWALRTPTLANHVIRFLTEPTSRSYIIAYPAGRKLCRSYVAGQPDRFRQLLTEQVRVRDLLQADAAAK